MQLTKFGHACVRIDYDGAALVIDPGCFTAPGSLDAATAIAITHQHIDHYDPAVLRTSDAPIFTIAAVADAIKADAPDVYERVTVVAPGDQLVAGLPIEVVGELHAVIHEEFPRFFNSGYVVTAGDQRIYHPGDALTAPPAPVDVLCVPVSAPWMRASEAVDFARAVGAPRNLAIHDRVYSDAGLSIVDGHMRALLPDSQLYKRLGDGTSLDD